MSFLPERSELIVRRPWLPVLFALLIGVALILLGAEAGSQRARHQGMRQALRANNLSWEICRAAEGLPAKHARGGGWIRTDGLTSEQLEKAESSFDEWVWTDAAGKFTAWPGHEDDSANEDDDVCSTAWRAGYSAATEEVMPPERA